MTMFPKRNGRTTPVTADSGVPPAARSCRGCGDPLEADQLACLSCGAVDAPAGGRERRWLLPTSGVAAAALLLVTSASFATTTALRTGDPKAVKEKPPAVAQAIPPASGDGTAPGAATDPGKGPNLDDLPGPPASDAAPPAAGSKPAPPADDAGYDDGGGGSTDDNSSGGGSGGNSSGGSGGSGDSKPDKPDPKPVRVPEWPAGTSGYTVILGYKFNTKAEARAKAREVREAGLPAGIVDSDDYKSLEPGSWLVYVGRFSSAQQAENANDRYSRAGYPGEPTYIGQTEAPDSEPSDGGSGSSGGDGSSGGGSGGEKPGPSSGVPLP
jgi:hypothetical protein